MVIDPSLEDKVRVTVIATGFGDRAGDETTITMTQISGKDTPVSSERLEVPTFARKSQASNGEVIKLKKLSVLSSSEDEEKYEIPAFLRKQAD